MCLQYKYSLKERKEITDQIGKEGLRVYKVVAESIRDKTYQVGRKEYTEIVIVAKQAIFPKKESNCKMSQDTNETIPKMQMSTWDRIWEEDPNETLWERIWGKEDE